MSFEQKCFFLTVVISLFIILLVIVNTYLFVKSNHMAALLYIIFQGLCVLWIIFRLAEIFAPTKEKLYSNITVQYLLIFLISLFVLFLCYYAIKLKYFSVPLILAAVVFYSFLIIISFFYRNTLFYYISPAFYAAGITIIFWIKTRKQILSQMELSLKSVIKSIGDCILVLDTKNRIMDSNYSFFEKIIDDQKPCTYMDFCRLLSRYSTKESDGLDILIDGVISEIEKEIQLDVKGTLFTVIFKATPLLNDKMDRIGMILTFHDISEYWKLLKDLENKKEELLSINDMLKEYINVEHLLEEEKEKRDIAFKIQNSIGQDIMELLTVLEVVRLKTGEDSLKELELAIESCRNVISEIRCSVSEIERS